MGIHSEERGLTFPQIKRKTPVLRPVLQLKWNFLCGLHRTRDRNRGGPNDQIVSVKRTADGRRRRNRSLMKREKSAGPTTDPCGTPRWTRKERLCDIEKLRKRACQKEKIGSNEQSKEEGQPKCFMEKGGSSIGWFIWSQLSPCLWGSLSLTLTLTLCKRVSPRSINFL